jgi:histone-lysine N-methyltransferase SETMAR
MFFICLPAFQLFFNIVVFVTMEKSKLRIIFEYEFRRGTNATQTARDINKVFGADSTSDRTVRFWFDRFRSGNFNIDNEPRGRPETKVNNDELKVIVEADSSQSTSELAAAFNVNDKTILIHLNQIGKIKKLGKWVPYELTEQQQQTRVDACINLLNRHTNEGILNRIVTCDEKWILYDNRKRPQQWLDRGEAAKSCPKRKLSQKKLLVSVWWTCAGIVHYSFLRPGLTITAEVYCKELQTMMDKLAVKQPRLVNCSSPLLLHDNARPHTAQKTVTKLLELRLESLRHPPYSPDLAPTDFHFFRNLDNFIQEKIFRSEDAVKNAFKEFIDSRPQDFYRRGINELPFKWQKCIDNNGQYFD